MSITMVTSRGDLLWRDTWRAREPDVTAAGLHGIAQALAVGRRVGARTLTLRCTAAHAIAVAARAAPVPDSLVGLYLQVRALIHTYKAVRLIVARPPEDGPGGSGPVPPRSPARERAPSPH